MNMKRLEIHGRLGIITHAVLQKYDFNSSFEGQEFQMFDFQKESTSSVKGFLMQYIETCKQEGYNMLPDPLSTFYEALCVGLKEDDFIRFLSDNTGDFHNNNQAEAGSDETEITKIPLAIQKRKQEERVIMEMEMEMEPRVKPLIYKVKAMSRESPAQKAAHVLDTDLQNHWSTATNTKEWILLELNEPALLSHLRIYNKSVLEWEVSVGLRYKPETFVKVRPRFEAPRRDMTYPMNYTPCRYVRISCMRGNPIAIFFIQLIGISVVGLEPEFQSVANYLLPHITSQKQDAGDMHLQLLQDVTSRLARFIPQLEVDLNGFPEAAEPTLRFLAMLAGPFYPILQIVTERESARLVVNVSDYEATKTNLSSTTFIVSSNFEPRRSRNVQSEFLAKSSHVIFRSDAIFMLLRKAYKDSNLGNVCRMVSRILSKISEPPTSKHELPTVADEPPKSVSCHLVSLTDYSNLFGEEFQIPDDMWDLSYLNVLDNTAVEEGLMHVLHASASQPLHCSKLAETTSDLWLTLPLVQALLPALRPIISSPCQIDDRFSLWKQPFVQNAMSQIAATSSSSIYHPLLRACAGYLSSFSPSHAKTACVLIDLCSGVLAPWMGQVIAKVDLTVELLEDFLGVIQGARLSFPHALAAIKYIVLALSGNMDDIMARYKDAKQRILFLVEMLEPFLDPAITPPMGMIAFGKRSPFFAEDKERNCALALNVLRTAVRKFAVLPSLEAAWRRGSVSPSVLLSVLDTQMQLPPDIDRRKFSSYTGEPQSSTAMAPPSRNGASLRSNDHENTDVKVDDIDTNCKMDVPEDATLLFAPPELNRMSLFHVSAGSDISLEVKKNDEKKLSNNAGLDAAKGTELYNLLADYSQLVNYRDCELKADEFRRLALDLNSRSEITQEGQDVAIDALLLAAECYIIPHFMMSSNDISPHLNKISSENNVAINIHKIFRQKDIDLKMVADIERKRDRVVLEILIEAAELDRTYRKSTLSEEMTELYVEEDDNVVNLSQEDILSADAVTLVRQNQSLLCNFLIQRMQRDSLGEQNSTYEILMWCLLFLLHSATKLSCSPEHVVDVILKFAEYINLQLKSFHYQFKEGNSQLKMQRRWNLLQKLVVASSGSDERSELSVSVRNDFRFSNLIPPRVWLLKVPTFSSPAFPLVRYFGWMAVARNADQYLKERLLLVSDLSQLTHLLSIFSDDLSLVDDIIEHKDFKTKIEEVRVHPDISIVDGDRSYGHQDAIQSFRVIYPDISKFFPNLKKEFETFGETILEAVGVQIKFLSTTVVPDLICWFSDLCSSPFVQGEHESNYFRGFVAKNAKAVILYVFEAIVVEHMEAMVPEIPRVVQVLVSLCSASYCDVSLLDSILRLLKPIIVYSLGKVPDEEKQLVDESCENFESLCFGKLFNNIKENQSTPNETGNCPALTIFVLATIFGDLSFHRKTEVLQSTLLWAEFASFEGTTVFHDYLCAYQVLMDNCKDLMIGTLRVREIIPLKMSHSSHSSETSNCTVDDFPKVSSWFLCDILNTSPPTEIQENPEKHQDGDDVSKVHQLTWDEIKNLSKDVEALISKLNPTMERCWKVHHKLAKKLAITSAECFVLSRCLFSFVEKNSISGVDNPSEFIDEFVEVCRTSLEGLAKMIFVLQENHCWEVAFVLIYSILEMPQCFRLDKVIGDICSAVENFSNSAPNITWRLQTDKIISLLLTRNILENFGTEVPLSDLFSALLGHPELEQRYIALKHLGRILGQDIDGRLPLSSTHKTVTEVAELKHSSSEVILSRLVSATWDQVALMASSDTSLHLRIHATALLISFIPFAERGILQSFLAAADSILQCLTTLAMPTSYGPLTQFSLVLIASVCLYSPAEDISLIPETIWRNIETLAMSRNDKYCTGLEKKACKALYRVKNDGDQAKQLLKEVLSSSYPKHEIPDFVPTRESILKVIGNLTSARSYFDFFAKEADQKIMELEEAEIERELLQREHLPSDSSFDFRDWRQLPFLSPNAKDDHRLQQIKDEIKSIEKEKLRQEIVARRQQKLLLRHSRRQSLEEAALREADLLQKLDRERINEVEKDLERQELLELERAKTRELRHNLDMEKEKQAQRVLQRELEQVKSGIRPSRREFASFSQSGPRDRHRERENDREVNNDGNLRTSTRTIQRDSVSTNTSTPTVVLSGTRSFSTQPPTMILQSRERSDDCNSSYEENFDGSRDSGDTGSVGEPDTVSALEGQSNELGFGPGQRQGSRGGKSRQIVERREREGRREGKWERKQ